MKCVYGLSNRTRPQDKLGSTERQAHSDALLCAADILRNLGRGDSSQTLLDRAIQIQADPSVQLLPPYWDAIAADDMRLAQGIRDQINHLTSKLGKRNASLAQSSLAKVPEFSSALWDEVIEHRPPQPICAVQGRILYVLHNSRPYDNGGYATRAHGLALGLQDVGFDVHCLTRPGYPIDMHKSLQPDLIPAQDVIDKITYHRDLHPKRRGGHTTREYGPPAADVIEAQIRKLRPQIVIAASAYVSALPALVAARRTGVPFVYEVRGFWEITRVSGSRALESDPLFRIERALETHVAGHADQILTLTGAMRDELGRRGISKDKVTLAPNSCDPTRFTPRPRNTELAAKLNIPPDVAVIGYIGTFVQYEGLDDLAHACARLHAKGIDFRLLVVGSENTGNTARGSIAEKIARIAKDSGFADKLIMPGRIPHDAVESYYDLIDIAPFPRKPQPVTEMVSPMKPLEALAMKKAVLVSSVQALTEMVQDGQTGLVFEKGNLDSLTDALARLIADPALRQRLGEAGRKWVEANRSWRRTAGLAKQVIDKLIASPQEKPSP